MKQHITKLLFGLAAALLVTVSAQAQTWTKSVSNSNANFNVRSGSITSGTALTIGKAFDTSAPLYLVVSSTVSGQAVVFPVLADGSPGGAPSQTITVNNASPTIISYSAPLPFTGLIVSPAIVLSSTNAVVPKIIQTK